MTVTADKSTIAPASILNGAAIRAGLVGGLVGGCCIWIYEAVVWVGVQHQMPLAGIRKSVV